MIYETMLDPDTKEILIDSQESDFENLDDTELMHGDPIVVRDSYRVYPDGLLFSTFPWALPAKQVNNTGDSLWVQ